MPNKYKVLLVEDAKIAIEVNKGMLQEIGCEVDVAENAIDALSMALQGEHDLILMDIGLPDGNGIDVTKEIRRSGKKMPIIALTAYSLEGEDELKAKCSAAGMNETARKPTTRAILEKFVITYIENSTINETIRA